MKATEALPGIIGAILGWILNKASDIVGWVSQNVWTLVVGIGSCFVCTWLPSKN